MAPSAGEPPLRSYTINLADDAHARTAVAHPSGPEQPAPLAAAAPQASAAGDAASTSAPAPQTPPQDSSPEPATRSAQPPPAAPSAPKPTAANAAPASTAAAPPGAGATGAAGAWMVQLGSFASRVNADHLAQDVRAKGFQVSVSQGSSGRRLYRVRVGPAHDRAAATQLAQKLHASGHNGSVVPK
jgi:cell division septation protein DedD